MKNLLFSSYLHTSDTSMHNFVVNAGQKRASFTNVNLLTHLLTIKIEIVKEKNNSIERNK